jgi:hypothetical protein
MHERGRGVSGAGRSAAAPAGRAECGAANVRVAADGLVTGHAARQHAAGGARNCAWGMGRRTA